MAALVGLRDRLPLIPQTVAWAQAFAAALSAEVTVQPGRPQTNQFLLYAAGDADTVNERTAAAIEEHQVGLPAWSPYREPGHVQTEVVVTPAALDLDPGDMAAVLAAAVTPG